MKVYKFIGNEKDLEELGYTNLMNLFWGKITSKCSIVIFDYVSIKINGLTYTEPKIIKPYIKELIDNDLVKIKNI